MAKREDKKTVKKVSAKKRSAETELPKKKKRSSKEEVVKTKKSKKTSVEKTKKSKVSASDKEKAAKLPKPIKEKMTKTQLLEHLMEETGLEKKQVKSVLDALESTILGHVRKKGAGEFMMPGMFKVVAKHIPAKKGGEKKMSFGKEIITKSKPATTRIKVRPMKKLKDAALL